MSRTCGWHRIFDEKKKKYLETGNAYILCFRLFYLTFVCTLNTFDFLSQEITFKKEKSC